MVATWQVDPLTHVVEPVQFRPPLFGIVVSVCAMGEEIERLTIVPILVLRLWTRQLW